MESGFKCGSGEPGSSFCVMMDILYHVPHLCGGFFAIFNELNSKSKEGYFQGHSVVNKQLDGANIDEVRINGFYTMVNPTGGTLPFSDNLTHALIVCGNNSATGKFYASQIAIRFSDGLIRVRVGSSGVWNEWKTIS